MAEQAKQKPELSGVDIADLYDIAAEIKSMPAGAERDFAQKELQGFFEEVMQVKQMPTKTIEVERPLLAALDYIPGVLRTAIAEGVVAGKDKLAGKEVDTATAKANLMKAVNPFDGEFAPGGDAINERLGVQDDGASLADTDVGKFLQGTPGVGSNFQKGHALDFTKKGLKALPWDLIDPAILIGGMKKLAGKGGAKTARTLEKELGEEISKVKNKGAIQKTIEFGGGMALDPGDTLGKALYRDRLKNADAAALSRGARPVSDVLMEEGMPGITSSGIAKGIEDTVAEKSARKQAILDANTNAPPATLSQVMDPLNSPEFQEKAMTFGDTDAYLKAREGVKSELEFTAKARVVQQMMQDPALAALGQDKLMQIVGNMDLGSTPVSPRDLEKLARSAQDKASAARVYAKPSIHGVRNMTDLKMIPSVMAEGDLQHGIGMQARDLQAGLLDSVNPGAGGEVFQANKDLASLLTGAPYVDRSFSRAGNASSRSQNWARSMTDGKARAALDAALGVKDVAQTASAKALRSPWMRYAGIPAGRAEWMENFEERDQMNPWTMLKDYIPKEK